MRERLKAKGLRQKAKEKTVLFFYPSFSLLPSCAFSLFFMRSFLNG